MNEAPTGFPCAPVASPCMAPAHRDDASQRRTSPSRRQPPGAGAWGAVVRPLTRTGSYYAESWRDYLDREPRELPIARPSIALAAHAFRDEIVLLGLRARRPVSDVHAYERINAEVDAALDFYRRKGWLDNPARFFAKPPPLTDVTIRPVKARRRSYERISFDSGYTPRAGEPGNRHVTIDKEANGTANVWGHVLVEDGVALDARLDAMARSDCKGDPRAPRQPARRCGRRPRLRRIRAELPMRRPCLSGAAEHNERLQRRSGTCDCECLDPRRRRQ